MMLDFIKIKITLFILILFLVNQNNFSYAQSNTQNESEFISSAQNLYKSGKLTDAEQVLEIAIQQFPKNINLRLELINLYINIGDTEKAQDLINKALLLEPNNPGIFSLSASLFYKNSQFDQAELLANKTLSLDSKNSNAYLVLGNLYFKLSLIQEDLLIRKSLLKKSYENFYLASVYNPALPDAHIGLARIYAGDNKQQKAYDELLKAQELDIHNPDTLFFIGEFYFNSYEYEKALIYLQKSILYNFTEKYKAHFMLATIYESLGDLTDARNEYLNVLKCKSDFYDAKAKLDSLSDEIKTVSETNINSSVSSAINEVLSSSDKDINLVTKADAFLMVDRYAEARDLYHQILMENPYNVSALSGILELNYSQWTEGILNVKNYLQDSQYLYDIDLNSLIIPKIKFQLVSGQEVTGEIRKELELVSNSYDTFNNKLNAVRALFILGKYSESEKELHNLLSFNLSYSEKVRIARCLYLDRNFFCIKDVFSDQEMSNKPEFIETMFKRISIKTEQADRLFERAKKFYKKKKYHEAMQEFSEIIRKFPAYPPAHLYYAYSLNKLGLNEKAVIQLKIYQDLCMAYPSIKPEIKISDFQKLIKKWEGNN